MGATKRIVGWKLDCQQRDALLELFPPLWPDVIADHVTLESGADPALPGEVRATIVGEVNDEEGLQAMVVAIDGSTDRPDGSTYHITWSLDRARGRKPVESNKVIAERGWTALPKAMPITLEPAAF